METQQHSPHLEKRISLPPFALAGGIPTPIPDGPIIAVFLAFFVSGAVSHMTVFQLNKKRGHKFIASAAQFGFNMARIVTLTLRLVWMTHLSNASVAIAAMVFLNAGIIIYIFINIIFTLRIIRAQHPRFGWNIWVKRLAYAYMISIGANLVMLIETIPHGIYTTNPHTKSILTKVQRTGGVYNTAAAFLPIPILLVSWALSKYSGRTPENFGVGRHNDFTQKIIIILAGAAAVTLSVAFRVGTNFLPRPMNNPAWYHGKAAFYVFTFVVEVILTYSYLLLRVDLRFWIPNGAKAAGDYERGVNLDAAMEGKGERNDSIEEKEAEAEAAAAAV
jgi:hypothetical protein